MLKETNEALRRFAKHVVSRSRANLTRNNTNVSKGLYDSIGWELEEKQNGDISLKILMKEYGMFLDAGVRGADPSLVKNGKQKAPLSKFTFRNKKPPMQMIADWAKARNIRLRDEKGRFAKGNYRTIGFILQKRIFAQGIKPTMFLTKPFAAAFENLPQELIDAYALDISELLKFNTNE